MTLYRIRNEVMNNAWNFSAAILGTTAMMVLVQTQATVALSATEVSKRAKSFTVRITSQSPGSGVIIKQQGNTYTVLTAAHVVATEDDYEIRTPDGQAHSINVNSIQKLGELDLAIIQFTSDQSYPVSQIGDSSQVSEGNVNYVAGFPVRTQAITESIYSFTEGKVTANASQLQEDGYSLVYSNSTLPGMSGGPVLNTEGQLIGIHGRADTTEQAQDPTLDPSIYIKTGFNLGIPINRFLAVLPQTGVTLGFAAPSVQPVASQLTADDYYLEAHGKMDRKDYEGAIADFGQAILLNPTYVKAYLDRGFAYLTLDNSVAAVADSNQVIRLDPNNSMAYLLRGFAYSLSSQDIDKARVDFQEADRLARANGDLQLSQTAQQMSSILDEPEDEADTSPDIKSSMVRVSMRLSEKDVVGASKELQRMAIFSCEQEDMSSYLTAKMMLRMVVPSDIHQAVAPKTLCPTFIQDQAALIAKPNQLLQVNPNDVNAYMERGLIHAEVLGDTQKAIPDIQKAADLALTQNKTEGYKGAVGYLKSLQ